MTTNDMLSDLGNKSFHTAIRKLTGVEQINLETSWTDFIHYQVDFGNKYLLKGFQYRLVMEDV